jgi:hypothetical protein
MKRLIDANPSDFRQIHPNQLIEAIRLSEGRTVVAEIIATAPPLIDKVSNVELVAAFGADLILLNLYDVTQPRIVGMPSRQQDRHENATQGFAFGEFPLGEGCTLADAKAWTGRAIGLNLEPIERSEAISTSGRLATPVNARLAVEQGADFIVVTGNPNTGVTTSGIVRSMREIRTEIAQQALIFAGKVHAAGAYEPVVSESDLNEYVEAGADCIVLPAPGTVPGMTVDVCRELVHIIHSLGALALSAIGTSQEGASKTTIEQIALMSKMTGADLHHIGDAGTMGIAIPENIYTFSLALRGRRHTWHRMAASLKR